MRASIHLIAAVGRQGQIGLGGHLPWHEPEDLRWFKETTMGGRVVVGFNTAQTLPALPGREVLIDVRQWSVPDLIELWTRSGADPRTIWIAGGAKTYARWLPFVDRSFISHIDYASEADTFMPNLWSAS